MPAAPHPPGPPALSSGPGSAPRPPSLSEVAPQCARPKRNGAIRSGCVCRAPSCPRPCPTGLCPLLSAEPWRPRSAPCGGRPGEALVAAGGLPAPTAPRRARHPAPPPICHRMKSLEQDALRAQMVLSKSQEGRSRRGPLERLAEAPSPAPTPSPTPVEGLWPVLGGGRPAAQTSANAYFLSPQTSGPRPAPPLDAW